jgi:putative MATE family efflux protein
MVAVNIVNIFMSFMLAGADWTRLITNPDGSTERIVVLHNPFSFNLGIAGIAWGTVIAEAVGAIIIFGFLVRGAGGVRLRRRRLKLHWHTSRRLVRLGLPNFFETLGMWAGNFLVVLMVGSIGAGVLGSHVVAIRLEAFSFLPGFSMGIAAATLAGQYLGAGSPRLARAAVNRCMFIAMGLMGTMGMLLIFVPGPIVRLFTSQPSHLEMVPKVLAIAGLVQIPFAMSLVHRSALRGVGATKEAMWLTWISTYAVRLPLAFFVSGADIAFSTGENGERFVLIDNPVNRDPTLQALWLGMCLEILIRCALFAWVWFKGDWAKRRV